MQIKYNNQEFEAEKIIKRDIMVSGFNENQEVFTIIGIGENDTLIGEYIEEVTDKKRLEALEQAMLEMILGGI